jgi:hypothetical protein
MYEIRYIQEQLSNDFAKIPLEARKEAIKYFKLFEEDYDKYTLPLYDMDGRNLQGCQKTYFGDAKYRIISKPINDIINIIAVGKRENMEVYKTASHRINNTL